MTIPGAITTRSGPYTGDDLTTVFDVTFPFLADEDLLVVRRKTSTGVETDLTLTTDYTVTGAGDPSGGTVTLVAGALATGYTLAIVLAMESAQETDLINNGLTSMEVLEDALDKLTLLVKQVEEGQERCLQVGPASPDISLVLDDLLSGVITDSVATVTALVESAESYSSAAGAYADEAELYMSGASAYAAAAALYAAGSGQKTFLDEPTPPTSSSGLVLWGVTSATTGYTDLLAISTSGAEFYMVQSGRVYLGDMVASDIVDHDHTGTGEGGTMATSGTGSSDIPAKWDHYHKAAVVSETQANGVAGGGIAAGANKRTLNTEISDPAGIVSLVTGAMRLQAGTYLIHCESCCAQYTGGAHRVNLKYAGGAYLSSVWGGNGRISNGGENSWASFDFVVRLAAQADIELYSWTDFTKTVNGKGQASSSGGLEVYSTVTITKLGES